LSQSTFAGFIITVLVHTDMASPHLHHAGTAAQKAKYMTRITSGECITAVGVSEPGAGSDVAGIRTTAKHHAFDFVIFATGFDAFTGSLYKPAIVGRGGITLREKWADGPVTQLGVSVSDFPNMLIVVGPGSPSLLSNVMVSIEEQIDWLAALIKTMDAQGIVEFEAEPEAEQAWVAHVNERARETLYLTTDSYYNGAEVRGKARVFMPYSGGVRGYRRHLRDCAEQGYSGFALRKTPAARAATSEAPQAA
jgi:cyclohexanone monooxygenase